MGTQQLIQQQITQPLSGRISAQHDTAPQPKSCGGGRRLATVIALRAAEGHEMIAALRQRLCQNELQLASLVTAARQASLVVSFNVDLRTLQLFTQPRQVLQRSGILSEPDPRRQTRW